MSWDGKKQSVSSEEGTELCPNIWCHLDVLYSLQNQISEMEEIQGIRKVLQTGSQFGGEMSVYHFFG